MEPVKPSKIALTVKDIARTNGKIRTSGFVTNWLKGHVNTYKSKRQCSITPHLSTSSCCRADLHSNHHLLSPSLFPALSPSCLVCYSNDFPPLTLLPRARRPIISLSSTGIHAVLVKTRIGACTHSNEHGVKWHSKTLSTCASVRGLVRATYWHATSCLKYTIKERSIASVNASEHTVIDVLICKRPTKPAPRPIEEFTYQPYTPLNRIAPQRCPKGRWLRWLG